MAHSVVLEHTTPDGGLHFDWMIEDAGLVGERRLRTWRLQRPPFATGEFWGDRIADHRALYLDFEGDLGAGRGAVRRVDAGVITGWVWTDAGLSVSVRWDRCGLIGCVGRVGSVASGRWEFRATRASVPGDAT